MTSNCQGTADAGFLSLPSSYSSRGACILWVGPDHGHISLGKVQRKPNDYLFPRKLLGRPLRQRVNSFLANLHAKDFILPPAAKFPSARVERERN